MRDLRLVGSFLGFSGFAVSGRWFLEDGWSWVRECGAGLGLVSLSGFLLELLNFFCGLSLVVVRVVAVQEV